ncbi:MAG: AIM24 family protein, partial [Lacticaseibacillus paracasei]
DHYQEFVIIVALDLKIEALDGSHEYVIDNSHVVAWDSKLNYNIQPASGIIGFTTGEGLVNRFSGSGTVYIQTRNIEALANLVQPFLPSSKD